MRRKGDKLLSRDNAILEYILCHIEAHGEKPTCRRLQRKFRYRSVGSITQALQRLAVRGRVRLEARGYHVVGYRFRRLEVLAPAGAKGAGS